MTTRFVKELSALVSSLPFLWVTGVAPAAAQERECGDRDAIRARVTDQSGFVPLARAEVVIHWSDVDRTPLRRGVGDAGYVVICAPRDARRATLWAEIDDESSEQAVVDLQPGEVSAVGLRILLERDRRGRGRLVGRVYDARWRPRSISQFITNHKMLGSGMVNRRVSLGFSGRPCRVNVYLDGVRLARGNVDAFVLPIEVGGSRGVPRRGFASRRVRRLGFPLRRGRHLDQVTPARPASSRLSDRRRRPGLVPAFRGAGVARAHGAG